MGCKKGQFQRHYKVTVYCVNGSKKNKIFTSSACNTRWQMCYDTAAECKASDPDWPGSYKGYCKDAWHSAKGTGSEGEGKCTL